MSWACFTWVLRSGTVISDLFGDQRSEDLSADLHQLAGSEVRLERPFVPRR